MLYFIVMSVFVIVLFSLFFAPYTFYGMIAGISVSAVNVQSLLLIFLLAVPMFLISGMTENLKYAFSCMAKRNISYSKKELSNALEAIYLAKKLILCAGGMGSLIVFITGLHYMDDVAFLGPMVSGLVYPLFFSIFFLLIFYPIEAKLKKLMNNLE